MIDPASNPPALTSINPATMEEVGRAEVSNAEQVRESVRLAGEAFPAWRDTAPAARSAILRKAQQLLISKSEEMAASITMEMGRPFVESMVLEVESTVDLIGYCAGRTCGMMRPRKTGLHHLLFKRRKSVVIPQPLGALGVIAPWNWPLLIPMGCIVPALAAGNTVVFKPSELTPVTGRKIGELLWEAGVPEGVFRIVQGEADTGRALADSGVEKLFFTGSTEVGKRIMERAAQSLKKAVLEMGGSDAAVVCEDADLDFASSGVLWGGMNNCGQNCNSVERVFVHRKAAGGFVGRLVEKSKRLRVGDGMNRDTDVGPLASKGQLDKMEAILRKSKDQNGRVLCGGNRPAGLPGYFFEPTVLFHETMPAFLPEEELFGPVLVVIPVRDDDEAVRLANRSVFGLSASVWTGNAKRGEAVAVRLETGSVMVNDVVVSFGITEASWTGIKKSGVGWVHGEKGMDEMLNLKYVNRDPQDKMQKYWWFPYGSGMVKGIKAGMVFMHGAGMGRKMKAMPRTLASFAGYLLGNRRKRRKW